MQVVWITTDQAKALFLREPTRRPAAGVNLYDVTPRCRPKLWGNERWTFFARTKWERDVRC